MRAHFHPMDGRRRRRAAFKPAALALALASAFALQPELVLAQSNPSGGVAILGQMSTSTPAPNQLKITTQNGAGTNHSAINWQSFSIGASNSTVFQQPSAGSTVINRVVTNTPTSIFGSLTSNGRVVLVNQAGIAIGAGAVVDTAGFTASALRMSDADALAGRLRFGDGLGSVSTLSVDGRISVHNGDVVLVAPNIEVGSSALIHASNGSTVLAAGQQVEITGRGLEGISMLVQAPGDQVRNLGRLQGDAVGIFAGTLRHSGEIQATTARLDGGTVVLKAGGDAIVEGAGKIIATGSVGGHVDVLGNRVAIADQALIDVSGANGGGVIRVGGDYQGGNALVPNAQMTYLGPEAVLKANAIVQGDGGKVIVWADNVTRAYGSIEANAAGSGGGGLVETSGHRYLDVNGIHVLASGSEARPATWLLDPSDVTITHAAVAGPLGNMTASNVPLSSGSLEFFTPVDGVPTSTLTDANINQFINGGSNLGVTITTTNPSISGGAAGDITFDGSTSGAIVIDRTNNTNINANTLRFNADRDIKFTSGSATFRRSGASTGKALTVELNPGTSGAGKISVSSGATVVLDGVNDELGVNVKNGKVWQNAGTVTMNGLSVIRIPNETSYASFSNLTGGVLNINSSSNWSFLSDSSVQGGILTNAGTVNVNGLVGGTTTAWEALFSNLAGGTLNVGAAKLLSMQNGGTLAGAVFIDTGGTLLLSEQHAGPVAFTNTAFSGAGALTVGTGVTANFNGSSGTVGQLNVGGSANLQSGTLNVGSYSQPVGSSSFAGAGNLNVLSSFNHTGGSFTPTGNLSITQASGNLNFNETVSVASLNLTAATGTLATTGAATSSGAVTFTADDMNIAGAVNAPSATVTLRPATLARDTAIEASNSGGVLSLQPSELQLVTANVLAVGRLDGTGNLSLTTPLTSGNVNAGTLRLLAGNNFISSSGADIGSGGTPFNHLLELRANNDVQLTNGNVFLADNKGLVVAADNDSSNVGNVNIGAITLQQGSTTGNTSGGMLISGRDINVIVSGGGSADIRVTGAGTQSLTAANNVTIANSNTAAGNLLVGTDSGLQTVSAANLFLASAGTGTATYTQVYSSGNQSFTGGGMQLDAGASGSGNDVTVVSFAGSQSITVGASGLHLTGGGGGATDNFAALYQFGTTGTSQTITVNGGGGVQLQGGSSAGTNVGSGSGSFAKIQSNGDSQQINFVSSGNLAMQGGTIGSNNFASIEALNGTQSITGASSFALTGGSSGGVAGEGNSARIAANASTQAISAGSILLQGGAGGAANFAQILGLGNQTVSATGISLVAGSAGGGSNTGNSALLKGSNQVITVGSGGLSVTGGGGTLTDNSASVLQFGTTGTSQTITVNGGGAIVMQGGSSAMTNVGGSGHGSRALIEADGDSQQITMNGGGTMGLTGGTNGSRAFAEIYAKTGTQNITGPSAITINGGASGGFTAEGNAAGIFADVGLQTVSGGSILMQGGASGIQNRAQIVGLGGQNITATGLTLTGGADGGGFNNGNRSEINTNATQFISVGAGGIQLTGGGGALSDNAAQILQSGVTGTQTINVNNGAITIVGGSSAGTNVGGTGHGSRAQINATGTAQSINFTGAGSISMTGGSNGSRNFASIFIDNTGTQSITGAPSITVTGGTSGGTASEDNSAGISTNAGSQSISAAAVTLQGGAAGTSNGAYISAPAQTLVFSGDLSLTGGTAGDVNGGARIGGNGGTTPSNTNLNLTVGGKLTLVAGASSGVAVGASNAAIGLDSAIVVNTAGNVVLNPSATQGVRIGAAGAAPQTGSVSVTAGGNITLNSGGGTGVAAIRSLGNVSLSATNAGKSVTEAADSLIIANQLTVTGNAGVSLAGAGNQVNTLNASSAAGNISFSNAQSLNVASLSTGAGPQAVSISAVGGGSNLSLAASTSDDNLALVSGGATTLTGPLSANSISITSGANLDLGQNLTTTGNLNLITPNGNTINQSAGSITAGGQTSINAGSGNVTLTGANNDFNQIGAIGGIVRIHDFNAATLLNASVQKLVLVADGNLSLTGAVSASGSGDAVALASNTGTLNASGGSISTPAGRWLLYAATPSGTNLGTLTPAFKQYNATLASSVLGTGNGVLFGLAPTLTAVLGTGVHASKPYDGNTGIDVSNPAITVSASGVQAGDAVSLNKVGSGVLADKNVGLGKNVTVGVQVASATSGGAPVFGYTFLDTGTTSSSATAAIGDVTAISLAVAGITASNKVYNANLLAPLSGTASVTPIGSDIVSVVGTGAGLFADKNVGTAKPVTVGGFTLSGTDAGNYTVVQPAGLAANIRPAPITSVSGITAANKIYDGNTTASLATGSALFAGRFGSDVLTVSGVGAFTDKNAGLGKTVNISGLALAGADAGNYSLSGPTASTTADISKATISAITGVSASKDYDGRTTVSNADLSTSGAVLVGKVAGDSLTLASVSGNFLDTRADTGKALSLSGLSLGGVDSGNYLLASTTASSTGTIRVRPVSNWIASAGGAWSDAANWDVRPEGANVATVVIPAGAGAGGVVLDAAAGTVTLQGISSARQLTQAGGVLVSNQLALNTQAGVALSNGANRISALNASNTGSGDIVLANGVPLNVLGLSNDSGNIQLVNTGAITTTGPVAAPKGNVSITANSPLSIGLPGVNAGGSISLVASNLTSAGNLTLDGPVRAGDRVILNAGNNLYQNSAVFGVNGVSATAGGGVFYGPLATANNAPISYAANGASVAAPPTEIGAGQAVVSDVINFGDKFSADIQQLPATASDFNRDGTRKHKAGDSVVSEGEVCR